MESLGDLLREARLRADLKQVDVEKRTGINHKSLSNWEHNVAKPSVDDLITLSKVYRTTLGKLTGSEPPQELIDTAARRIVAESTFKTNLLGKNNALTEKVSQLQMEKKVWIPVLGTIVGGNPSTAYEDRVGWEDIPISLANQGKFFALRVKGRSMEPKFIEGDTVIVKETPCVDSGRVAVVLVDNEDATLKQVNITQAGITLIGYNTDVYTPTFYSNQEVETLPVRIIGEVVELRRKI